MSNTRKVAIKFPQQNGAEVYEISSTNYGELVKELKSVDFSGKEVVIRETKQSLKLDEAVLPIGDFTLYLFPTKVKSGLNLNDLDYNKLRSEGSRLNKEEKAGIDLSGTKDDLIRNIENYLAGKTTSDLRIEFENAKEAIILIFDELYKKAQDAGVNMDNVVFITTQEEVQAEFEALAKQLGVKVN